MATNRLRHLAAVLAALVALAVTAAPAWATSVRVEGPRGTVFQGPVQPFVGALKDTDGASHTTAKTTALGALVTASRSKPFSVGLAWSDAFGGGWNGFYLTSVNRITPPVTAFWAVKVGQTLTDVGLGAAPVTARSRVLVYYTTFDPVTFATKPTLGIAASRRIEAGSELLVRVNRYDDAGTGTPAAGAWVWVNGVGVRANAAGVARVRLQHTGLHRVQATLEGAIRSKRLWVQATS